MHQTAGHDEPGHDHDGMRRANRKRLWITLVFTTGYMVAEIVGGLITNSLALLADAGHMMSDVAGLALAIFAQWIAQRKPTPRKSYGYYRVEILAALINAATLIGISLYVFVEAIDRMSQPPDVAGGLMMIIATGGLAVNIAGMWILSAGKSESLNMKGAWLHVATDALGSIGAIVGALLIWFFKWDLADPIISIGIGVLIIFSSWSLLKDSVAVLMENTPADVDPDVVTAELEKIDGVQTVHDLHIWTVTSGITIFTCHLVLDDTAQPFEVLKRGHDLVTETYGIKHVTIQVEPPGYAEVRDPSGI